MRPGGIRTWQPDPDADADDASLDMLIGVLRRLNNLTREHITGTPCPDCACLLRDDLELCPACVIPWCRAQEEPHRRLQAERANRRGWWNRRTPNREDVA